MNWQLREKRVCLFHSTSEGSGIDRSSSKNVERDILNRNHQLCLMTRDSLLSQIKKSQVINKCAEEKALCSLYSNLEMVVCVCLIKLDKSLS